MAAAEDLGYKIERDWIRSATGLTHDGSGPARVRSVRWLGDVKSLGMINGRDTYLIGLSWGNLDSFAMRRAGRLLHHDPVSSA